VVRQRSQSTGERNKRQPGRCGKKPGDGAEGDLGGTKRRGGTRRGVKNRVSCTRTFPQGGGSQSKEKTSACLYRGLWAVLRKSLQDQGSLYTERGQVTQSFEMNDLIYFVLRENKWNLSGWGECIGARTGKRQNETLRRRKVISIQGKKSRNTCATWRKEPKKEEM